MMFPVEALVGAMRDAGLVVAVLLGFGFGFVLERAGFGRATKLAAQFYLYDMTVFKVMFGAIVTAMLGLGALDGLGAVSLAAVSATAASETFVWPMMVGGLILGAGFILSGYCPGTSMVATASGNLDGLVTIGGVLVGSVLFGEAFPLVERFYTSGAQGQLFLYQWLGISPGWLAVGVAAMAVSAFVGAEKLERIMTRKIEASKETVDEEVRSARTPRRFAFAVYATAAIVIVATLLIPVGKTSQARAAQPTKKAHAIAANELARSIVGEPWKLRILDLRGSNACAASKAIPGALCTTPKEANAMGLQYANGGQQLVLVGFEDLRHVPKGALKYPGEVRKLTGGYAAWRAYALTAPKPPSANASPQAREEYQFRSALYAAMANQKMAPAAPAGPAKFVPKKKKGGGCG